MAKKSKVTIPQQKTNPIKNFFLPTPEVSAQRRLNTFGSTSKTKTGAIILGTAAVAIAAPFAYSYISGASAATAATAAGTAGTGAGLTKLATVGGAGLIVGSLLNSGSKATTGPQTTTPKQDINLTPQPKQDTQQNPSISPTQKGYFDVSGSNNKIEYRQSQDTSSYYTAYALPNQTTPSYLTATQETTPTQSATSESGTNWLLIAGIAAGAYILAKR